MKEELIYRVDNLYSDYEECIENTPCDSRELLRIKSDANILKSELYVNKNRFKTEPECFLQVNRLTALVEKVAFEMDYTFQLLRKIREKAMRDMGHDAWQEFLQQCKKEM